MARQDPQQHAQSSGQSDMQIDYSTWSQMTGEDYSERLEWQNQDTSDVLEREAKVGTVKEEAYILQFSLDSTQKLTATQGSTVWFDTSLSEQYQPGEDTRSSFGTFSTTSTKVTGKVEPGSDEDAAIKAYIVDGTSKYGGRPPILTWASVNDASLTSIKGDLDAYYGEYAVTREVNTSLAQWQQVPGLEISRIWTLGNLEQIGTTITNYASTDDGGSRYGNSPVTQGNITTHSDSGVLYGDGELAYLSDIAGYEGLSMQEGYEQANDLLNLRVTNIVQTMLVADTGNQIVNRTVDQGALRKT